jgi:indolepyruvate ferredoxin oxidoreductase, alpha subunit
LRRTARNPVSCIWHPVSSIHHPTSGIRHKELFVEERKIFLGNEAIALGLLEAGCTLATSYPGTPASEVLGALGRLREEHGLKLHLEWSVNEKVAFEVALANSYTGRRSAAIMKQVGLNVATDPLMSSAYTGVKGGFVVVSADDPGPHSSQTEQDSRFHAMMAKIPVLDPASPQQARELAVLAFSLSSAFEIPVLLRPTTRVCHARQDMTPKSFPQDPQPPLFEKNPARWAATPKFRLLLHRELNDKIGRIAEFHSCAPKLLNPDAAGRPGDGPGGGAVCIVGSGVVLAYAQEILVDLGLWDKVPLYQVVMPYPLSSRFRDDILARYEKILVLEESYPVIEYQLRDREKVLGRLTGTVPSSGELLPETIEPVLRSFLGLAPSPAPDAPSAPGRRPTLCAGCPHRAAFFAIKKAFPKGIFPGDIGCYSLGLNLGVVDTILCMGASISQASGFYHAYSSSREDCPPICATIGDSTFFHAGVPPLMNAVVQGARFVLVVMDNSTTAMTGRQPTPASGRTMESDSAPALSIPEIVRACGVKFVEQADPYDLNHLVELLRSAGKHARDPEGGVAVVITKRPCLMEEKRAGARGGRKIAVTEKCKGCDFCYKQFECPALIPQGEKEPIRIDYGLCTGCGVCIHVCPHKALIAE